jgi:hypothetical protein
MSRQSKRRADRQLDRIRAAQRDEDKLTDLLNYSWLQEFVTGADHYRELAIPKPT